MLPPRKSSRYIMKTVMACRMVSSGRRREKQVTSFLRRKAASAVASSVKTVVVLQPPAVEPGEPPMSIKSTRMARPLSLKPSISMVL